MFRVHSGNRSRAGLEQGKLNIKNYKLQQRSNYKGSRGLQEYLRVREERKDQTWQGSPSARLGFTTHFAAQEKADIC